MKRNILSGPCHFVLVLVKMGEIVILNKRIDVKMKGEKRRRVMERVDANYVDDGRVIESEYLAVILYGVGIGVYGVLIRYFEAVVFVGEAAIQSVHNLHVLVESDQLKVQSSVHHHHSRALLLLLPGQVLRVHHSQLGAKDVHLLIRQV